MTEYEPSAIKHLSALIEQKIPRGTFSGILGDSAHTYGYHRSRNVLPGNDYSVTLPADRAGDGNAACALDTSFPTDLMKLVTARVIAAMKAHDPRVHAVREIGGTTNGTVTHSYDQSNGHEGYGEWDDSHLWHIHLSIYREYAENAAVLAPIADVMAGTIGDDMSAADVTAINAHTDKLAAAINKHTSDSFKAAERDDSDDPTKPSPGHALKTVIQNEIHEAIPAIAAAVKAALA